MRVYGVVPSTPLPPLLLIDDNEEDLMLTQLLLEKSGITNPVLTAIGGEEAIELLRQIKTERVPFMVLCDVRMPQVDGLEVLRWARSQPRLSQVYFAMHSGGDVPADRARARTLGADEYLLKFPTTSEIRAIAADAEAKRQSSGSAETPAGAAEKARDETRSARH